MAIFEFRMPDIGEGVAEGEIVSWKVAVGDTVQEEQDFVEVMTDKATVTITSPVDGTVAELLFQEGEVAPVETVIARFETAGEGASPEPVAEEKAPEKPAVPVSSVPAPLAAAPVPAASPGKVLAAPATRKLARERGVDLSQVAGTGKGGRVTREDLMSFLAGGAQAAVAADGASSAPAVVLPQAGREPISIAAPASPELEERVPFRGVRKKTAEAMARSKFTATHFSVVEDMDVTELVALRKRVKAQYEGQGLKVTYMPFIMKAVMAGLREFPWLNSSLDESSEEILLKKYYNLGIATDTDNGLIVPVIKDVDRKNILTLARELQELAGRTREGGVKSDELRGGTFTITNAGNIGGLFATPIINFPEVAILGVHKIQAQPRVVDGEIKVRDIMYCSVSIDHRIVDGADGVRFLNVVKRCLENPQQMLLEL
ncbi:MAG: dienelactone hydrolase [Planctomycetota bacterium]|nr:MAG: dienelactone hydrolase [Planctomycetota bacterium]